MYRYILTKTIRTPNITRSLHGSFLRCASDQNQSEFESANKNLLQFDFNSEESQRILKLLNEKSAEDLMLYEVSKGRAFKIQTFREKHGHFSHLDEILNIEGIGLKIAEKFFKSLLNEPGPGSKTTAAPRKQNPLTVPAISSAFREECRSCVALRVGVNCITWTRLEMASDDQSWELTHWEHHEIFEKKLHLSDLIKRSLYLDFVIPEADCYVFENPQLAQPGAPGSADQTNISVQKSQLLATLAFAFANRQGSDEQKEPNVYFLKRFLTSRLFSTLVGNERVSAADNVRKLLRLDANEDYQDGNDYVELSSDLRNVYRQSESYQKEFLGQTLLLALSFFKLAVVQCPKSLALVSNRNRGGDPK